MYSQPISGTFLLMNGIGDTKAGTLIATDRYGNKYFENLAEELPCKRPI